FLIRTLGIEDDRGAEREEREARIKANQGALETLNGLAPTVREDEKETLERLRIEYEDRLKQLESYDPTTGDRQLRIFSTAYDRLSQQALQAERRAIIELRNRD